MIVLANRVCKCATTSSTTTTTTTFSPNQVAGLQVWYDTTDNATITTSGSQVLQINDKSGNANNSITSGQKPLITTDALTGMQVFNMDPSDSGLPLTVGQVNDTFTFFLTYKLPTIPGNVLVGGASPNNNYIAPTGSIIGIGGAGTQSYQQDDTLKEIAVFAIRQQSGVFQYWEFNGRQRIRTAGTVPAQPFYFNCVDALNSGNWCGGEFESLLYYDSALSDSDAFSVVKYLVDKYNINPGPYYKIIGFGDSYTIGLGASDQAHAYLYLLGASLGKYVVNSGISGSRFQDTGGDLTSGYNRYPTQLIEYPYRDRVYILYGFNDITQIGASAAQYQTQLDTMITNMISLGYDPNQIYIGTVPRMYGDANSVTVQAYGTAVRTVCTAHGCHCAEVYQALTDNGGDSLFAPDHIHPNDAGHLVIANAFLAS